MNSVQPTSTLADSIATTGRRAPRTRTVLWTAAAIAALLVLTALCIGQYTISPRELLALLSFALVGTLEPGSAAAQSAMVLFELRLPRVVAAFVVGAGLAAAGAAYQNLFRNPLVSPDILGVASGAALGAVLAILAGAAWGVTQSAAFAGGLVAVGLILLLGHRLRAQDPVLALVLTGVVIGSLFGAGVSLSKYVADPFNKLPAITFWLLGSFANLTPRDAALLALMVIAGVVPLFLLRWRINVMTLPDDEARTLGVDVARTRIVVVIAATLLTAASVAVCGMVGWVGLVIPHAARLLVGGEFSRVLPLAMLIGGSFMLLIDTLARSLTAAEIPPGVLTAMIGAPAFIALMLRATRGRT